MESCKKHSHAWPGTTTGSLEPTGSPRNPSACRICSEISLWDESSSWGLKNQTSVRNRTLRFPSGPSPRCCRLAGSHRSQRGRDRQPVLLHNLIPALIPAPPSS